MRGACGVGAGGVADDVAAAVGAAGTKVVETGVNHDREITREALLPNDGNRLREW